MTHIFLTCLGSVWYKLMLLLISFVSCIKCCLWYSDLFNNFNFSMKCSGKFSALCINELNVTSLRCGTNQSYTSVCKSRYTKYVYGIPDTFWIGVCKIKQMNRVIWFGSNNEFNFVVPGNYEIKKKNKVFFTQFWI